MTSNPLYLQDLLYQQDLAYIHQSGFGELSRQAGEWILPTLRQAGIYNGTVVELGCGSGSFLATLTQAGYSPVGIDISAPCSSSPHPARLARP
jgi:2-polyprenyl-3-methyl-5-hydroxy-6-metoxy-1,4-benzoquinol methylase